MKKKPTTKAGDNQGGQRLDSSFRDPAGFVYADAKGDIYRQINSVGWADFFLAEESGLHKYLAEKNLLVAHKTTEKNESFVTIKPKKIGTVSYPFEWSFSMLKDSALTTLKIQKIALKHNMSLKDASAYNIQFCHGKPSLIDTLSFEKYQPGAPWVAYGQFCRHFLAPLALMSKTDIRLSQMLREYIDGIPLDLASKLLPSKTKMQPALLMHLHMHAKAQSKKANDHKKVSAKVSKTQTLAIIDSLERCIQKLQPKASNTEWMDYYDKTNYSSTASKHKTELIKQFAKQIPKAKKVLDLGGNDGTYSRIFSDQGIETICSDIDPFAVEYNYKKVKQQKEENMLPLLVDLINPAGGLGWANKERAVIEKRLQADTVMALALVHHLAISNNMPFAMIAEYFSRFGGHLIVEFIPKSDSQVKKLLSTREDVFSEYDKDHFEEAFGQYFKLIDAQPIKASKRTLYLYKRKR